MSVVTEKAEEVFEYVRDFRRDLHQHPEESLKEFRTTDRVCEELDKMGVSYRRCEPTGVLAEITGTKPSDKPVKRVALRGDMDALSITEKTGLPFASQNPGVMHACGHDTHTSMLLGAVKVLNGMKDQFSGSVRFMFQPAEETGAGAALLVQQGAMKDVDYGFGMHIAAQVPCGVLAGNSGAVAASCDQFKVWFHGRTTHGAYPELGMDATVAAAAFIMNVQTVVSREFPPMTPLVVTVGQVHSGSRFNIVSGEAWLDGTIRCLDEEVHKALPAVIDRIAKETAATFRCTAESQYDVLTRVLVCDPKATDIAFKAAAKVQPDASKIVRKAPGMGGEDFAEYTFEAPCAFLNLGADGDYPHHSENFFINEESFKTGVAMYVQAALDYLDAE